MKPVIWDYGFLAALAVGIAGITLMSASPVWYLTIIFFCLIAGVWYGTRTWPDRAFYLVCAGEPLILACGSINLWTGLFVIWMVAGLVCNALRILVLHEEIRFFILFCGATVPVAVLARVSNHVVLPLLLLCTVTGIIIAIQAIRNYKFRKQYSGVRP
ncbi:hypothetical protein [Methanoregula sp.]|uniref:hypothetical protein n=1 Tax=Methanoregula sp. TaxID=2052170 RepID=UPI00356AF4D0